MMRNFWRVGLQELDLKDCALPGPLKSLEHCLGLLSSARGHERHARWWSTAKGRSQHHSGACPLQRVRSRGQTCHPAVGSWPASQATRGSVAPNLPLATGAPPQPTLRPRGASREPVGAQQQVPRHSATRLERSSELYDVCMRRAPLERRSEPRPCDACPRSGGWSKPSATGALLGAVQG
jgi:hypothetical protein